MSEISPSMKLNKAKAKPKVTKNPVIEAAVAAVAQAEQVMAEVPKQAVKAEKVEAAEIDLILQVAQEVENMNENKAFAAVPKLLDNIEQDYFKLGGVIGAIQSNGWFMDKGHENFKSFVIAECGIEYRKAMYLIGIYNSLVQSGVKWSDVKHLGWTKLKEIADILTPANVSEWVGLAENMTTIQLQEYIKQQKAAVTNDASGPTSDEVKKTTTMTFKLHEDQKATVREALEKCKSEMNTEFDAVALEHIALDFLSGDKKLKKVPTLAEQMKSKSAEEVLEAFSKCFPDFNVTVESA